jgi:DNA polymerase-1
MAADALILVDGSSYLYRAYHALPALTNSRGEPTGAVYGVANMLRGLIGVSEYVAVVFDAKGKTFRDDLYPQYKANRPPMPAELAAQIAPLHELARALGFPLLVESGVEADDVIATLTTQADGMEVRIYSGDKDLAQLVKSGVSIHNTMSNSVWDEAGVEEKFGVPPRLMVDYLALMGDSVDNVPGVAGVGPKTAVKWLQQYGSLDAVIAHAAEVKGKIGDNLRAALDRLNLSRQLVTVKRDVKLSYQPTDLKPKAPDMETLRELYQRLEFKSWLGELKNKITTEAQSTQRKNLSELRVSVVNTKPTYAIIQTEADWQNWLQRLQAATVFAFDTETTGLDYLSAQLVGISFALAPGKAAYVPLAHDYLNAPPQLAAERVMGDLKPLLEDPARLKIGQNLKFDMHILRERFSIEMRGAAFDTLLESYILDSSANQHNLDVLALKYLGWKTIEFKEIAGKGSKQLTFNEVPVEVAGQYAAEDADVALRLHQVFWPKLKQEPKLKAVYEEIEIPLLPVLLQMECNGVKVDANLLHKQSQELGIKLKELEKQAFQLAASEFNLNSPKQLQEILFEQMQLPVLAKTPTGQPSTSEDVLQELALDYTLPRVILQYRSLSKLKSTYTDRLPQQIHPKTGRVHTSFQQAVAQTGRLSSSDPNLQNIPIRTEEGRRIRQAFVAPPGFILLAADYSQIELRIMAHLSQDAALLRAFAAGEDIHQATAAEMFGVAPEQVSKDQRRNAKAINFGLIYGMSAFGLGKQLGVSRGVAQAYVERYFARYPGVQAYMENTRKLAAAQGYIETVSGRRLYLPDINARKAQQRQYAERAAINAPMQGTAADIIKRAMIRLDRWLQQSRIEARMILQVHDELVFEVVEAEVETARAAIRQEMVAAGELAVPLLVDIGVGKNWDEAH